jgi:hypothetical protein
MTSPEAMSTMGSPTLTGYHNIVRAVEAAAKAEA